MDAVAFSASLSSDPVLILKYDATVAMRLLKETEVVVKKVKI